MDVRSCYEHVDVDWWYASLVTASLSHPNLHHIYTDASPSRIIESIACLHWLSHDMRANLCLGSQGTTVNPVYPAGGLGKGDASALPGSRWAPSGGSAWCPSDGKAVVAVLCL